MPPTETPCRVTIIQSNATLWQLFCVCGHEAEYRDALSSLGGAHEHYVNDHQNGRQRLFIDLGPVMP